MSDLRAALDRFRARPDLFAREVLGIDLWAKQTEALCAWRDNRATSWRSGNGVGKTLTLAAGVLWVGSCWKETSVLTTATTFTQVKGSLWNEIGNLIRNAKLPLGCEALTTEIRWPKTGSRAFAITAPPHEKDKPKMAGFRGRRGTYVAGDEASGLSASILEGISGMLTGDDAHLLLTGNPLDGSTAFKRTFDQESVYKIKTDAFSSPNFTAFGINLDDIIHNKWRDKVTGPYPWPALTTPASAEDMFHRFGRDVRDPRFMARVLAEFPEASPDTVIPMHWIEAAFTLGEQVPKQDEPKTPVHLGVDVARFGSDSSAISRRRGIRGKVLKTIHGHDTMQVTGAAVIAMNEEKATEARIDEIGVGAAVVDAGRAHNKPFVGVNVGRSAMDQQEHFNLRTELWWGLRDRFEATYRAMMGEKDPHGVPIQPGIILEERDDALARELNAPRWSPTPRGQKKLEPKEETSKRLGRSPDRADSLVLAFAPIGSTTNIKIDLASFNTGPKWNP